MSITEVYAAAEIGTLYHDDERSIEEKYGRFIAPFFQIEIADKDNNPLFYAGNIGENTGYDLNGLIISDVEVDENIEGADSVSITILNPNLDLQDSTLFEIGNNIDVFMGYDGRATFYMMRGIIVELEPHFPAESMPTIKLKAYDKSYFMMEEGKAEIVPDGSRWWERRRRASVIRTPLQEERRYNNTFGNRTPTEDEEAENEIIRELAAAQGEDVVPREVGALDSEYDNVDFNNLNDTVIEGGSVRMPSNSNDPFTSHNAALQATGAPSGNQGQLSWQRQRFGRRRRNAGHVWRGKTDSEIVAAIFQSYDIVPYVEATNERRRRATRTLRPSAASSNAGASPERSGHPRGVVFANDDVQAEINASNERRIRFNQLNDIVDPEHPETIGVAGIEESAFQEGDSISGSFVQRNSNDNFYAGDVNDLWENLDNHHAPPSLDYGRDAIITGEGTYGHYDANGDWIIGEMGEAELLLPYDSETGEIREQTPSQNQRRTRQREVTQRAGTSDWDFIVDLGEQHGFITFVFFHIESQRWIGYWGPEGNVPQFRKYTFQYNVGDETSLGDVQPKLSVKNQSTEIDLIYVDPVNGRENRLRVALDNLNENMSEFRDTDLMNREPIGNGPDVVLSIHGQRVHVNADRRFTSAEDARRWLMAYWMRYAEDFFTIEGNTIVGIPEMRAREYHNIHGIGRYSAEFFITQARHVMGPGKMYSTSFVGRAKNPYNPDDEQGDDMLVVDQSNLGENQPEPETETFV